MKYFLDTEFHEYSKKPLFGKSIDTIELISIGIVSENNREYYAICKEFDIKTAWNNKWLRENVLLPIVKDYCNCEDGFDFKTTKRIFKEYGKTKKQIAREIIKYIFPEFHYDNGEKYKGRIDLINGYWVKDIYQNPEFYAYYADYDWVVFCWLFGRMIDLPKGFPMYCNDLKQTLDEKQQEVLKDAIQRKRDKLDELDYKWKDLKEHRDYPKQIDEHNALEDAKWNYELYKFLQSI